MRKITILLIFSLCLLLTGCGKDKPEPTTAPPLPDDMLFVIVDETVTAKDETNLRNYPGQGEESTVLFTLSNGDTAQRTGISESGWSRLEYQNTTCYAVTSYLTTDLNYTPAAPQAEADDGMQTAFTPATGSVTAKEKVNLRSLPGVDNAESQIIGQLQNGDVADVLGTSDNGWTKLEYEGQICYAVSSYLTTDLNYTPPVVAPPQYRDDIHATFAAASGTVTAKDVVNLRTLPSVSGGESQVLCQLHKGETAERIGISDTGWTKLLFNDKECYAVSNYLTTNLDGTSDDGDGTIKTQFADVNEQVTAKDAVNLRTLPSTTNEDAHVVKKLLNGEVVTRTGINPDLGWSRVEYEGQTLYCISNYLKIVPKVAP